jgi:hypothetical protein
LTHGVDTNVMLKIYSHGAIEVMHGKNTEPRWMTTYQVLDLS